MTLLMAAVRSLPVRRRRAPPDQHDAATDEQDGEEGAADDVGQRAASLAALARLLRHSERRGHTVAVAGVLGRPQQRVVAGAVLDEPDPARVGLGLEAGEPVVADCLADAGVGRDDVGGVVVELLLHLHDGVDARRLVRLLLLLRVHRVLTPVAVPRVGEPPAAVAGEVGQDPVRVGLDVPVPLEGVVGALQDVVAERAAVHRGDLGVDAELPQPLLEQVHGVDRRLLLAAGEQPQLADRRPVRHRPLAVRAQLVASRVQLRTGLVEVEGELLLVRGFVVPLGVGRRHDRRGRLGRALVGGLDDLRGVDGVAEGVPELRVEQGRVAVADRLTGVGVDGPGVEPDLLEERRDAVVSADAGLVLERLHLERGDALGEVDLALDQGLHHRVGGLVDLVDDLVHVRRAAPVVLVGLELVRRPAGGALDQPERSRADHRLTPGRLGGVRLERLLVDVLPDVLGNDRDRQQGQRGVGLRELEPQVRVFGGGDAVDVAEVARPVVARVPLRDHAVGGVGDVVGRQGHAVGPLHAGADVEGPGLAVVGGLPLGRQVRLRRHVVHRVADHVVVGQRPHLVGVGLEAQERVEGVDVAGEADGEDHRIGGLRGGGGAAHPAGQGRGRQERQRDEPASRWLRCERSEPRSTVPPVSGPPLPPQEPYEHVAHGLHRPDPYHWMRRLDAGALAPLVAERDWYDSSTGHLIPLVQELRAEMTGRVPATDSSISWPQHGYSYYTVTPAEREYVQLWRRRDQGETSLLLDVNELAAASDYVELGLTMVSPDSSVLAYSIDSEGDEVYELRFRDLASGQDLVDVVPRSAYGGAWSADSAYFFYTVHDDLWRQHQVWRHRLGSPAAADALV